MIIKKCFAEKIFGLCRYLKRAVCKKEDKMWGLDNTFLTTIGTHPAVNYQFTVITTMGTHPAVNYQFKVNKNTGKADVAVVPLLLILIINNFLFLLTLNR